MANETPIYVGKGKATKYGVRFSVCITDAEAHIFEYNGKKYLKLEVNEMKQPDKYGKTHTVKVDTYNPNQSNSGNEGLEPKQSDDLPF